MAMGAETFVDVSYRGIALATTTKLLQFGPTTAYLELASPMPVGTRLSVATDDGRKIDVEVVRTHELPDDGTAPGVRVRAQLEGNLAAWWHEHESGDDPVIPDPKLTPRVIEEEPEADAATLAAATAAITAEESGGIETATEPDADEPGGQEAASDGEESGNESGGRVTARTQMMSIAEIQDVIETGGDRLEDEGSPEALADDRPTEVMQAVDPSMLDAAEAAESGTDSDDGGKAKGKRKKRKRRNTRG